MAEQVEHEICGNCKKEIPNFNYVMHSAHCARNITLCKTCKEPVPKPEYDKHAKKCLPPRQIQPLSAIETSPYYQARKDVETRKQAEKREKYLERHEKFITTSHTLNSTKKPAIEAGTTGAIRRTKPSSGSLLPCKFCDLELPKLELEEHENYCGTRTDKCMECGENVMFKNKQAHLDTNHGFVKLENESGSRSAWDSSSDRVNTPPRRRRFEPTVYTDLSQFDATDYLPSNYRMPKPKIEKGESYKEISRRLDCKTEYIRNILHDSASITVPLRHNGAIPRNTFSHDKDTPSRPPRRRNPPTELCIPCEFCDTPIPHEELILHETGCQPDAAVHKAIARMRRSLEDDDYVLSPEPTASEVEIPCEFCSDMIPASRLYQHQASCAH